jgi:hypothetical protein
MMELVMDLRKRLEKIVTVADAEKQLELAKEYVKRIRNEAKKAGSLAEKLALNEKHKEAEGVLRKLRLMIFDIEDAIAAGQSPLSLLK